MKRVVAATEAALIADSTIDFGSRLPKKVYFMHGHQKEINAVLQSMAQAGATNNKRFPLIVLFRDIKESLTEDGEVYLVDFKARMGIFTLTDPAYRSDDREDKNFIPILKPILEEFIKQLTLSLDFSFPSVDSLELKYWDCYFYGSSLNGENIFNDKVDAIEIESISLKLINNNCTSNKLIST